MDAQVRIVMTSHGRGEVWVNGEKVPAREIRLHCAVEQANEVTLTLIPETLEVEGVYDVSTVQSLSRELKVVNS